MATSTTPVTKFSPFEHFSAVVDQLGPTWLSSRRYAAFEKFTEIGVPTNRQEDWRFTSLTPLTQMSFVQPNDAPVIPSQAIKDVHISGLEHCELVFINGRYNPQLSNVGSHPDGVVIKPLAAALTDEPSLLEKNLGRCAGDDEWDAFASLNTAMMEDGLVAFVPDGAIVTNPIYVLYVTTTPDKPLLVNPHNFIFVGHDAKVTVVEDYVSIDEDVYFNNVATDIFLDDRADVTHYRFERDSHRAFNISSMSVQQGRDSCFSSHIVQLGGAIARNNIVAVLNGENCWSQFNGLYVASGDQQADNHVRVIHADLNGKSRQYFKGIMQDRAQGVFRGRIVVQPGAQKTDAVQSNQNLLLSDEVSANSDPQLEIYADDVKCTHGSTTGELDENQLFYLRARGIPADVAKAMMIYAFASESVIRMDDEPIRRFVHTKISERLPAAPLLDITL